MAHPKVTLTQPLHEVLRRGHPWIWEDAINPRGRDLSAGDVVDVVRPGGEFVGRGVYDPDSPLRVRLWTLDPGVEVDDVLLEARIRQARKRRAYPTHDTTGYRLLHGEGDRIPGLVCDIYGEVGVLRPDGLAAERWVEPARKIIERLTGTSAWVVRRGQIHSSAERPVAAWLTEPRDPLVPFMEHGMLFVCDVIEGQKTGFFLDQRANRQHIAQLSRGRRMLNLFGYTGGFSVAAATAGAARTTTVDLAEPAIRLAERHFEMNQLHPAAHEFIVSDVFDYLERFEPGRAPFEVAVCDPPSFAHRRKDVGRASGAYTRLFARLLEVMPANSTVALASCSSHINRQHFLQLTADAARQAGCALVLTGIFGAGDDHPVLPGFPDGEYLQCVVGTVSRD